VRWERVRAGAPIDGRLAGAVLTRDLSVDGDSWAKGRRLSQADLERLSSGIVRARGPWAGTGRDPGDITLLVPETGDLHEDVAAKRLADAVAGPGVVLRGPVESRVDLLAAHDGVLRVRAPAVNRLDRIDPLSVFTAFDGQVVAARSVVASVKVAPHLVPASIVERAEAIAGMRRGPIIDVRPFRPSRVGALVRETLSETARRRFEASLRTRIKALGSRLVRVAYVGDEPGAVASALRALTGGPARVDILLTAGAASTDPSDPVFTGLAEVRGRVISHGVPAHPGSMLWLGRLGRTTIIGLPTCGAYSKATAVDLLLPWLLAGEPPTRATVARLGMGGLLTRDQRFRFPAYARELEAPEG
jgi:hypothetical protein